MEATAYAEVKRPEAHACPTNQSLKRCCVYSGSLAEGLAMSRTRCNRLGVHFLSHALSALPTTAAA